MKTKYIWWALFGVWVSCGTAWAELNPYAPDTLSRELILEKEYQPIGREAEKTFFNPLDQVSERKLSPIQFAKSTYPIAMNVHPRLFQPLSNPLASEPIKQTVHGRLYGGFPVTGGANIGALVKTSESGTLLLSLDHLSRYIEHNKSTALVRPIDQSHDTEIGIDYSHALSDRVLEVGVDLFHHLNTYYGYIGDRGDESQITDGTFPLLKMLGTELTFALSPAPLSLKRGWQYSVNGKVGFINKEDMSPVYGQTLIPYLPSGTSGAKQPQLSQIEIDVKGNLGYHFAGSDWGFGVDGRYRILNVSQLHTVKEAPKAPQMLSVDPYVEYLSPRFMVKAGAKLQLLNRGAKAFLVAPDVQATFKATDLFSLYLVADGGAEYRGLRELYSLNRWAEGISVYKGFNIANVRGLLGVQLGNINGFSVDLNGGMTLYSNFSDWAVNNSNIPCLAEPSTQQVYTLPTFRWNDRGRVTKSFVNAQLRYNSSIGLDLGVRLQYNSYQINQEKDLVGGSTDTPKPILGMPAFEAEIRADYAFNDRLSAQLSFLTHAGIKMPDVEYLLPNNSLGALPKSTSYITDLGARISYKVHKNIGLSLIGNNLLNSTKSRWLGYERQGATGLLAVTFTF